MKKMLLGLVGLLALGAAPALAADLAARPYTKAPAVIPPPIYDWSGFYIGINGGGGSAHKCWDLVNNLGVVFNPALAEGCHDATGGTIGGQIGYRWQAANWVFGLEAQGNWADFQGSNVNLLVGSNIIGANFGAGLTDQTRVRAFGLFTGQVGYAWNNVLWYVKGGAAVTDDRYRTYFAVNPSVLADTATETRWGGVVGTGIEIGFWQNWSVGLEYDHMFMGTRNVNATCVGNFNCANGAFSATDRIRQDVDIGTIRLNYRWGGPVVARY